MWKHYPLEERVRFPHVRMYRYSCRHALAELEMSRYVKSTQKVENGLVHVDSERMVKQPSSVTILLDACVDGGVYLQ